MTQGFLNRSRKKKLEALLQDDYVMLHLVTNSEGLDIPDHLKKDSSVTLKISFWFKGKLELGDDAAVADLSFSGTSHKCVIPYTAIWAVTNFAGEFELWDSAMRDQLTNVVSPAKKSELADDAPPAATPKTNLSLASEGTGQSPEKKGVKRPRPLLRRVK